MTTVFIIIFTVLAAVYAAVLFKDAFKHKEELKAEKGNPFVIAAMTAVIQFFSTLGISDFNISIPLYRAARLVDDKRLPGTLLTATVIPSAIISILYMSSVAVSIPTLIACLAAQSLGTFVGMRLVAGMNANTVRRVLAAALIVSTLVVLVRLIGFSAEAGAQTGLSTWVTVCVIPVYFAFGVVNMMGFGVKALSISLLMSLGLAPATVLLVVLSSCGVSSWCGAMQYVSKGLYQRKIAAISSVAGIGGVLAGSFLVTNLDTTVLQWIMAAIMVHAAITMLLPQKQ